MHRPPGGVRSNGLGPRARAAIELDDIGNATDAVADQAREDAPFALGPMREIAIGRLQEALGVAPPFARGNPFAKHLDVLAGHHLQASASEDAFDLLGSHRWGSGWAIGCAGIAEGDTCCIRSG